MTTANFITGISFISMVHGCAFYEDYETVKLTAVYRKHILLLFLKNEINIKHINFVHLGQLFEGTQE